MSADFSCMASKRPGGRFAWAGLIAAAVLFLIVPLPTRAGKPTEEPLIAVTTPQGSTILAEVADTTVKRSRGLMFRQSLARDRGMLFTFPEPQHWTFWMKNTRIPLDIIWIDRDKKIVHIERNVPGCSRTDDGCPQYQPNDEALYVLEVAAGVADVLKLQRGGTLQFQIPRPAPPTTR
jgi:uncharacterized membrane protein (UPF0127 family)